MEDRSLSICLKPNNILISVLPVPSALVASTDVNIIIADVHPACNVRALLVDAHQFTKTTISAGVRRCEQSSSKLALLTVPVTLTISQLGIFSIANGFQTDW